MILFAPSHISPVETFLWECKTSYKQPLSAMKLYASTLDRRPSVYVTFLSIPLYSTCSMYIHTYTHTYSLNPSPNQTLRG